MPDPNDLQGLLSEDVVSLVQEALSRGDAIEDIVLFPARGRFAWVSRRAYNLIPIVEGHYTIVTAIDGRGVSHVHVRVARGPVAKRQRDDVVVRSLTTAEQLTIAAHRENVVRDIDDLPSLEDIATIKE